MRFGHRCEAGSDKDSRNSRAPSAPGRISGWLLCADRSRQNPRGFQIDNFRPVDWFRPQRFSEASIFLFRFLRWSQSVLLFWWRPKPRSGRYRIRFSVSSSWAHPYSFRVPDRIRRGMSSCQTAAVSQFLPCARSPFVSNGWPQLLSVCFSIFQSTPSDARFPSAALHSLFPVWSVLLLFVSQMPNNFPDTVWCHRIRFHTSHQSRGPETCGHVIQW